MERVASSVVRETFWTLDAISRVAAPCCSTAAAMAVAIDSTSPIASVTSRTATTASPVAD